MYEIQLKLGPLLNKSCDDVGQIEEEMKLVAQILTEAAAKTLPLIVKRRKSKYWDNNLHSLCTQSSMAEKIWRDAGCPKEGSL